MFATTFTRVSICRPVVLQSLAHKSPSYGSVFKSVHPGRSRLLSHSTRTSSPLQVESRAGNTSHQTKSTPWLYKAAGVAGVGLGLSLFTVPRVFCDPVRSPTPVVNSPPPAPSHAPSGLPPLPESNVNYYQLTFGTVCGICAGVFVKKGAKALAFVFGGIFVLLQYLGQQSLVRVDWGSAAKRFENLFYTTDAAGTKHPPNVGSLFRWITDFLTANFQQRASFVAGFVLGLRIG